MRESPSPLYLLDFEAYAGSLSNSGLTPPKSTVVRRYVTKGLGLTSLRADLVDLSTIDAVQIAAANHPELVQNPAGSLTEDEFDALKTAAHNFFDALRHRSRARDYVARNGSRVPAYTYADASPSRSAMPRFEPVGGDTFEFAGESPTAEEFIIFLKSADPDPGVKVRHQRYLITRASDFLDAHLGNDWPSRVLDEDTVDDLRAIKHDRAVKSFEEAWEFVQSRQGRLQAPEQSTADGRSVSARQSAADDFGAA